MRWTHVVDVATAGIGGCGREGKDSLYASGGQSLDIFLLGFLEDALGTAKLAATTGSLESDKARGPGPGGWAGRRDGRERLRVSIRRQGG